MNINHRDIWDTNHVKTKLSDRSLTEGTAFLYFISIIGFDWLQFTLMRLAQSSTLMPWEQADAWLTFIVTIIGPVYLFWCNGGASGKDFLYRYFPLSFVVGWKFVVFTMIIEWAFNSSAIRNMTEHAAGQFWTAMMAIINIGMFVRMGQHFKMLHRTD